MGNPVGLSNTDTDGIDDETLRCIKSVKDLTPQNIKIFLEHFFGGMSLVAKETVVDILWSSMTMREQHLFDMPTSGRRLTDEEVYRNFGSTELNVMPRRVIRGLQLSEPSGAVSRSLRNRTGVTQVWPRIGFGRALENNSDISLSNSEVRVESFSPDSSFPGNVPNRHPSGEIGDHILSLLMYFFDVKNRDVVMRAEQRTPTRTGSIPEPEQNARRSRQ
jgi:hypothetical protein